jgi:hypothetical protein
MKPNDEAKRQAMSSVANVQTIAHVGMVKATGGIALYAARIRQMDRESGFVPEKKRKAPFRSAIERGL